MTAPGSSGADTRQLRRAGSALAGAAATATLFALAPRTDAVRFVTVPLPVVAVLLAIAALGVLGARIGHPLWFAGVAVIGIVASLLQFFELLQGMNWLGGNGSTASFLVALGMGYGALWYVSRDNAPAARGGGAD